MLIEIHAEVRKFVAITAVLAMAWVFISEHGFSVVDSASYGAGSPDSYFLPYNQRVTAYLTLARHVRHMSVLWISLAANR
jgi:hypothetical protein